MKNYIIIFSTIALLCSCSKERGADQIVGDEIRLPVSTKAQTADYSVNADFADREDYLSQISMIDITNPLSPTFLKDYDLTGQEAPIIGIPTNLFGTGVFRNLIFTANRTEAEKSSLVLNVDKTKLVPPLPMSVKVAQANQQSNSFYSGNTPLDRIAFVRAVAGIDLRVTNFDETTGEIFNDVVNGVNGASNIFVTELRVLNVPDKMYLDESAIVPSVSYIPAANYANFNNNTIVKDLVAQPLQSLINPWIAGVPDSGSEFETKGIAWYEYKPSQWFWAQTFRRFYLPENLASQWANGQTTVLQLKFKNKDGGAERYLRVPIGDISGDKRDLHRNKVYKVLIIVKTWHDVDPFFEIHVFMDDWQPYNSATPLIPYNHYSVDLPAFE